MVNIQRLEVVATRLGIGISKFYEQFMDHGDGRDVIPGTDIPRLRPLRMGPKSIGFITDEIDALIEALRRHRDSAPQAARAEPEHLRTGRDRYWKRQRRKRAKQERSKGKRSPATAESAVPAAS